MGLCVGSTCGQISRDECISFIAEEINLALDATSGVKVVLENMSRQGNTIGGDFKELKAIINQVKDKSRMGVCIDTCHAMAAGRKKERKKDKKTASSALLHKNCTSLFRLCNRLGYDLSTQDGFDQMMDDLDSQIGFEYLVALHLNDSKGVCVCHLLLRYCFFKTVVNFSFLFLKQVRLVVIWTDMKTSEKAKSVWRDSNGS